MLKEIQIYYSNIFKSCYIDETPILSITNDKNVQKLNYNTSKQLEGKLTVEEISYALKKYEKR